jgi:hypothetical protein
MLAVCNNLGLLGDQFFPTGTGRDYVASPYLQHLQAHRQDFSVFSGVSHPNVDGGHPADVCFLTAAPHPGSSSFRNTVSLDQHMAEQIGTLTRFPSLTLGVNTRTRSLSWTGTGVAIPPEDKAAEVFKQLFLQGSPEQIKAQLRHHRSDDGVERLGEGSSVGQKNIRPESDNMASNNGGGRDAPDRPPCGYPCRDDGSIPCAAAPGKGFTPRPSWNLVVS